MCIILCLLTLSYTLVIKVHGAFHCFKHAMDCA